MQRSTTSGPPPKATIQPLLGRPPVHIPLLTGISGSMRIDVQGQPVASIDVQNGQVSLTDHPGEPTAIANVVDLSDLQSIVQGELNPVVAGIQGRLALQGDAEFGIEVILALHAARPYASQAQQPEGRS